MQESLRKQKTELGQTILLVTSPEFYKMQRGYLLSEILEEQVNQKYYLSKNQSIRLMESIKKHDKLSKLMMLQEKTNINLGIGLKKMEQHLPLTQLSKEGLFNNSIIQPTQTIEFMDKKELAQHLIRRKEEIDNLKLYIQHFQQNSHTQLGEIFLGVEV